MAEARALGGDHRVDEREILALQDEMLEALAAADEGGEDDDEDDDEEGGDE